MFDKDLIEEYLEETRTALERVVFRFEAIQTPEDFIKSEAGREKFDAICMSLIGVGENIKKLDAKTSGELLTEFPSIDWKGFKGLREGVYYHLSVPKVWD